MSAGLAEPIRNESLITIRMTDLGTFTSLFCLDCKTYSHYSLNDLQLMTLWAEPAQCHNCPSQIWIKEVGE